MENVTTRFLGMDVTPRRVYREVISDLEEEARKCSEAFFRLSKRCDELERSLREANDQRRKLEQDFKNANNRCYELTNRVCELEYKSLSWPVRGPRGRFAKKHKTDNKAGKVE